MRCRVRQAANHRIDIRPIGFIGFHQHRQIKIAELRENLANALARMGIAGEHGDGELEKYSDYTTHDITVEYQTPVDGLALTFGTLNFTDEKPVLDDIGGYDDGVTGILYDLSGRRIFGSIRYTF